MSTVQKGLCESVAAEQMKDEGSLLHSRHGNRDAMITEFQ